MRNKKDRLLTEISFWMLRHPKRYKKGDPWRSWIEFLRKGLSAKKFYITKPKHKNKIPTNTVRIWIRAKDK